MPQTSLSEATSNAAQITGTSLTGTQNASLEELSNITGYKASLPSIAVVGNYSLNDFVALNTNLEGNNEGFHRTLQENMGEYANSNMFICTYASSYTARSFKSGNTKIYKNGTLVGTITSARGTLALNSLVIGDKIHSDQPFTFYNNSNPGLQGAYAGYQGYCFASRRDRYTKIFYVFNLDPNNSINHQIGFNAGSGTNVSSFTYPASGTISAGSYISYTTSTTGNYFILTDGLACAWQGTAPSQDIVMIYPMGFENKYGWFSSAGHTFSVNNAEVGRTDAGGNDIDGRDTSNASQTVCSITTGRGNAYSSISHGSIAGGLYFSGDAAVVYNSNGKDQGAGTILAAESQGDGNGGEMTTFTGPSAMARACVSGGGAAWNAFVQAGYSGSGNAYPNYGDVVMRFNSSGVFQDAEAFTGQNTTTPYISKAYFGNGSGTGTSANAGDFFYANIACQGYQDTDSTDKDESNMIMSNGITLPSPTSYGIYTLTSGYLGADSSADACSEILFNYSIALYSPSTSIAVGMVFFVDEDYDQPFGGNSKWFIFAVGRTFTTLQISSEGIVLDTDSC